MGRRDTAAMHVITGPYTALHRADRSSPDALRAAVDSASAQIEHALEGQTISKAEAAEELGVSTTTVSTWIERELLPTVKVTGYERERVPSLAVVKLAAEISELRDEGRERGLLVEALTRLEADDPRWHDQFKELYGHARRPFVREQYVSGMPGADWDPQD